MCVIVDVGLSNNIAKVIKDNDKYPIIIIIISFCTLSEPDSIDSKVLE